MNMEGNFILTCTLRMTQFTDSLLTCAVFLSGGGTGGEHVNPCLCLNTSRPLRTALYPWKQSYVKFDFELDVIVGEILSSLE